MFNEYSFKAVIRTNVPENDYDLLDAIVQAINDAGIIVDFASIGNAEYLNYNYNTGEQQ